MLVYDNVKIPTELVVNCTFPIFQFVFAAMDRGSVWPTGVA